MHFELKLSDNNNFTFLPLPLPTLIAKKYEKLKRGEIYLKKYVCYINLKCLLGNVPTHTFP